MSSSHRETFSLQDGSHPAECRPARSGLQAVLFDMDGVVTDTAQAHASAWKRLFDDYLEARAGEENGEIVPFDADEDYRRYVDGKPRYDGVRSFLQSRGIELDEGDPQDPPDRETIAGLGNRKNRYFREWLESHRVRIYETTVALIETLREAGIGVAVFSASRNCEAVLRNAGACELFDAKVDGEDLARRGLPGKPAPDMLLEAARRLGADPARAAVLEDSAAGVEAAARGGFACAIGIDRDGQAALLERHGASVVVADAGELALDADRRLRVRNTHTLPSVWDRRDALRARLEGHRPVVFLDYDGTLTPIVEDHTRAFLSDSMREVVAGLAERLTVGIVSGRDLAYLRDLVGLDSVYYAGSHGFELAGPDGFSEVASEAESFAPEIDAAEDELREALDGIAGHAVERKAYAIAVHYRRVAEVDLGAVEAAVDETLSHHLRLKKGHGKKVYELQPRIAWDKGRAILFLLERLGLQRDDVLPIYVGDDLTDENAFRVVHRRGVAIVVRDDDRATSAHLALEGPQDVQNFLSMLAQEALP